MRNSRLLWQGLSVLLLAALATAFPPSAQTGPRGAAYPHCMYCLEGDECVSQHLADWFCYQIWDDECRWAHQCGSTPCPPEYPQGVSWHCLEEPPPH